MFCSFQWPRKHKFLHPTVWTPGQASLVFLELLCLTYTGSPLKLLNCFYSWPDKRPALQRTFEDFFYYSEAFSSQSSKHLNSQTVWARDLKFSENVQLCLCVTCHISRVKYHLSHVTFIFTKCWSLLLEGLVFFYLDYKYLEESDY